MLHPLRKPHLIQKQLSVLLYLLQYLLFIALEIRSFLRQKLFGKRHILQCRILRKKMKRLKDHTEMQPFPPQIPLPFLQRSRGVEQCLTLYRDGSGIRKLQEIQAAQKRRLS